jgi:SlyX protein
LNESIRQLEEKIAYLERHVTEQDKAMLEFAEDLAALRREMKSMRDRAAGGGMVGGGLEDSGEPADERPPHY